MKKQLKTVETWGKLTHFGLSRFFLDCGDTSQVYDYRICSTVMQTSWSNFDTCSSLKQLLNRVVPKHLFNRCSLWCLIKVSNSISLKLNLPFDCLFRFLDIVLGQTWVCMPSLAQLFNRSVHNQQLLVIMKLFEGS